MDRLAPAGWLVAAAMAVVIVSLLTLTYDTLRDISPRPNDAASFFRVIGLNELVLAPSGRQERRPNPLPTPVDWRYLPMLPQQDPGLISLLNEEQLSAPQATIP